MWTSCGICYFRHSGDPPIRRGLQNQSDSGQVPIVSRMLEGVGTQDATQDLVALRISCLVSRDWSGWYNISR